MSRLTLQPDSKNGHAWVTLDGQRLIPLRDGDGDGLKVIMTCLVDGQVISVEEAAEVQGVTLRTVEASQARYAETGNSVELIDRRHFNPGQQTDYRMEPHKPELIRQATLNLVKGEGNSERGLAAQLRIPNDFVENSPWPIASLGGGSPLHPSWAGSTTATLGLLSVRTDCSPKLAFGHS